GRLDYQKGFDRLLDAWAMLPDGIRREWHLDIFGQGEWKERLEAQAARLGISDSASINPPTDKIFAEYADSSFLVMSSHYEGFPMVMIEAMASGLPVVSFDFPCGPRDIITPGTDGLIVQDGDIASLAGAMLELMENPAKIEAMSIRARKVSETYSEDKIMGYWEKCFKDLLS
ncbi:MAG: glycosyltransferase, partial [Bacteroidales bacterium]|nr:glycosyltransferase [Bacteroidales bacterium]